MPARLRWVVVYYITDVRCCVTREIGADVHRQFMRFGPMAQHIDDGYQKALLHRSGENRVAADLLPGAGPDQLGVLQRTVHRYIHLRAVTLVPLPGEESRVNSSIMRCTPGSPSPRVPLELK